MALVVYDRVQETTATTGTGTITLGGAVSGYQSFAVVGNGNTTFYCILNGSAWEVGIGTYSTTGPTLARTTILSNSNGDTSPITLVDASNVFVTYPSEKSVNLDASGNVTALGTITSAVWNGTTIPVAYGGTGVTASSGANSVVLRDAYQNITANNIHLGFTTTASSAGTTTLTVDSTYYQRVTGSLTQTIKLPDATTMSNGRAFIIDNDSSQSIDIIDAASGAIDTIVSGTIDMLILLDNSTVAGTWIAYGWLPSNYDFGTSTANFGTATLTNGSWNGNTIATDYGGTGLTTFTAANNALYSTSAGTLTAGTLPVAAGGTGATTLSGLAYGNGTSAFTAATGSQIASAIGSTYVANATNATNATNSTYATNISNTGTVTLASATESNSITASQPSYTTGKPVKLLNFDWYGNTWSLGNIRSSSTDSQGFGIFYGSSNTELGRFTTGGLTLQSGYSYSGAGTGLTGTASGLSIGGNAATVTGITNTTVNPGINLNTLTTSGFYRLSYGNANNPASDYGQLLTIHGGADTITQIYGAYNTGHLYTRSGNPSDVGGGGSWTSWLTVLDSGNYNSYSPSLTGSGASGTWGINVSGSAATATTSTNLSGGYANATYITSTQGVSDSSGTNGALRITNPGGASVTNESNPVTGAIEITLPQGYTNTMMRMTVRVFTYDGAPFDIYLGGYNYGGSYWVNTFAYMGTQARGALNVRFGYNGSKCVIYIGELSSAWYYPKVYVTDFEAGYSNYSASQWNSGWSIGFQASAFANVTSTQTTYPQVMNNGGTWGINVTGYAKNLGGAPANTNGSDGWWRSEGYAGLYFASYGRGVAPPDNVVSYGNACIYGSGLNGWSGWSVNTSNNCILMAAGSWGFYNPAGGVWMMNSDFSGNVTFNGNVTAYSDIRLKDNIREIDNPIERRNTLAKSAIKYERDGRTRIGYGAQYLRDGGCGEFVHENEDDAYKLSTGTGTLSVDYGETAAVLAVTSKMTDDKVAMLEDRISKLEEIINGLLK